MAEKTVLVVDDDPNVGLLISAILKNQGYTVTTLYSGEEVLKLLSESRPDLILMDLRMPGLDGYALCKQIRSKQDTKDIPIIILSGVADVGAKVSAIELGADDFITKPFDVRELRARVNRIILRKKADLALNPLTSLPGSPGIEEEVLRRLSTKKPFAFAYADADNFKAYNDVYGYAKGDDVIKMIAEIINDSAKKYSPLDYFIGHIGGDDFVLLTPLERAEQVCRAVTEEFDRKILSLYSQADALQGCITTLDRKGVTRNFPIMTLTIALLLNKEFNHYGKITETAAELKRYAKELGGRKSSIYIKDRRLKG